MKKSVVKNMSVRLISTLILLTLVIIAGCAAHTLRDAQDAFKEGAQTEWNMEYDTAYVSEIDILAQYQETPRTNYQSAYDILDELLTNKKSDLKKDNLLGTAQVLKATCIWKLNRKLVELENLEKQIDKKTLSDEQKALLAGVKLFMILDGLNKKIEALGYADPNAVEVLNKVVHNVFTAKDPIMAKLGKLYDAKSPASWRTYIMETQLAAYGMYYDARNSVHDEDSLPPDNRLSEIITLWDEYRKALHHEDIPKKIAQNKALYTYQKLTNLCQPCSGALESF